MSALSLSPKTSIVHGLYQQYDHPLVRVVQGLPVSWDPVVATASAKHLDGISVWSPCNRFIAISKHRSVQIFDAVTLEQVNTLNCPDGPRGGRLSFSPNGHFLTQFNEEKVISWDLQTGGLVCTIFSGLESPSIGLLSFSSTYSMDGKMFAILYERDSHGHIAIYNLFSGTYINSYCMLHGHTITPIWTHGECFRFTIVKLGSVMIWEAGFNWTDAPTEVETLLVPDEVAIAKAYLFLPTLSRLAFALKETIMIWDTKTSKFLLNSGPISLQWHWYPPHFPEAVFSSDGHFFVYLDNHQQVYIWRESPTCYALHQKLTISGNGGCPVPLISPTGGSIIVDIGSVIHLWHTEDQIPPSTQAPICFPFTLGFSPQNRWAAFAHSGGNTVSVLHLQSGDPHSVIDTDIWVERLVLTESAIVIAGRNKVAMYNLPAGDSASNTRMDVGDSVQAITLDNISEVFSISPDLNYLACKSSNESKLEIYELSTGKCIMDATPPPFVYKAWFTLDGHTFWAKAWSTLGGHTVWAEAGDDQLIGWKIFQDSESSVTKLEPLEPHASPLEEISWESSTCGYQIVDDVWVLSPTQKRLLWLPPHWRTDKYNRVWNGNFLGLRHPKPQEVVILEFLE